MAPLATAAPSVFTASPIHAPATMGSCERNAFAANGRISSSTTAKITTSEATMIGTMGRARARVPTAGADPSRHPADRDPRCKRRRPLAAEAEPFARDEVHHRPVDQIRLDDRRETSEQDRLREDRLRGRHDAEEAAQENDRGLDVQLRAYRLLHPRGETRKEIPDDEAGDEGAAESAFVG